MNCRLENWYHVIDKNYFTVIQPNVSYELRNSFWNFGFRWMHIQEMIMETLKESAQK